MQVSGGKGFIKSFGTLHNKTGLFLENIKTILKDLNFSSKNYLLFSIDMKINYFSFL